MEQNVELFGKTIVIGPDLKLGLEIHKVMNEFAREMVEIVNEDLKEAEDIYEFLQISMWAIEGCFGVVARDCVGYLARYGINDASIDEIMRGSFYYADAIEKLKQSYQEISYLDESQKRKKEKLIFDSVKKREIEQAAYMDVYSWIPNVAAVFQRNNIPVKIVSIEEEERGVYLFRSLKNAKLRKEQKYEIAYQMFQCDPSEKEYYDYCMIQFPEQLKGLVELYRIAGYEPTAEQLEKALENLFKIMPHETEEETILLMDKLKEFKVDIGIKDSQTIRKVEKMLVDFDIKARTFHNILFNTREIKNKAEKDFQELKIYCEKIDVWNEEECNNSKKWIYEQGYVLKIVDLFSAAIDKRIRNIWMVEDKESMQEIFFSTDIYNESDCNESIVKINMIGRTEDKERYVKALQNFKLENIKMLEHYMLWRELTLFGKYGVQLGFLVAGIFSTIVYKVKLGWLIFGIGIIWFFKLYNKSLNLKKMWDLLTLNGEVIHPQIQSLNNCNNVLEHGQKESSDIKQNVNSSNPDNTMICAYCGNKILRKSNFCAHCGKMIDWKIEEK